MMTVASAAEHLDAALAAALACRPPAHGFPHYAETLHRAGVRHLRFTVAANAALYRTDAGPVVVQAGAPLIDGAVDPAPFDEDALVAALRRDQAGEATYPEFLAAAWRAGVVAYDVDFDRRACTYHGAAGETLVEEY